MHIAVVLYLSWAMSDFLLLCSDMSVQAPSPLKSMLVSYPEDLMFALFNTLCGETLPSCLLPSVTD